MKATRRGQKKKSRSGVPAHLRSLGEEVQIDSLKVEGKLPKNFSLNLYWMGPAFFDVGRARLAWADGAIMLHRFSFQNGRVSYLSRFLRSRSYRIFKEGSGPFALLANSQGSLRKVVSLFDRQQKGKSSFPFLGIIKRGEGLLVLSKTGRPMRIDTGRLAALSVLDMPELWESTVFFELTHPVHDPIFQEHIGVGFKIGSPFSFHVYVLDDHRNKAEKIFEGSLGGSFFIPSIGYTKTKVLVPLGSLHISFARYRLALPFVQQLEERKEPFAFFLIDRDNKKTSYAFAKTPFFVRQIIHSFEQDGAIFVYALIDKDPRGFLEGWKDPFLDAGGYFSLLKIEKEEVSIDYLLEEKYIHASFANETIYLAMRKNVIRAFRLAERELFDWHQNESYPGLIVTADKKVFSMVYSAQEKRSFLLIADDTMNELAKIEFDHVIPPVMDGVVG